MLVKSLLCDGKFLVFQLSQLYAGKILALFNTRVLPVAVTLIIMSFLKVSTRTVTSYFRGDVPKPFYNQVLSRPYIEVADQTEF